MQFKLGTARGGGGGEGESMVSTLILVSCASRVVWLINHTDMLHDLHDLERY